MEVATRILKKEQVNDRGIRNFFLRDLIIGFKVHKVSVIITQLCIIKMNIENI